jgi:hypothetical protein
VQLADGVDQEYRLCDEREEVAEAGRERRRPDVRLAEREPQPLTKLAAKVASGQAIWGGT